MNTTERARKVLKLRHVAGLLAVLLLVSAEFCLVCHFGHRCGQLTAPPAVQVPGIGDLFAAR